MPGAVLLNELIAAITADLGDQPVVEIARVKFPGPVRPGETVTFVVNSRTAVERGTIIAATGRVGQRVVVSVSGLLLATGIQEPRK